LQDFALTIGFAVWVAFFAWRGYKKGVISAILGILSLFISYWVVYNYGSQYAAKLSFFGLRPPVSYFIAYPTLFFGVGFLITEVPLRLFPALVRKSLNARLGGMIIGGLNGVAIGLVVVWLAGLGEAFFKPDSEVDRHKLAAVTADDRLASVAEKFVVEAAGVSAKFSGFDEASIGGLTVAVKQPVVIAKSLQDVTRSASMQNLLNDADAMRMMANDDVASLIEHPQFEALMSEPGMQEFVELWRADVDSNTEGRADSIDSNSDTARSSEDTKAGIRSTSNRAEVFVANNLSFVWRRLQSLRGDPRFQEILNDESFRDLMLKNSTLGMLAHERFYELMILVMEETDSEASVDVEAIIDLQKAHQENRSASVANDERVLDEGATITGSGVQGSGVQGGSNQNPGAAIHIEGSYVPTLIYEWIDEGGNQQYSDYLNIPEDRRHSAKKHSL
jgi:uncharacterized membrane protein required for colicin V production